MAQIFNLFRKIAIMKKNQLALVLVLAAASLTACNNGEDANTNVATSTEQATSSSAPTNNTTNNNNTTANAGTNSKLPLNIADSTFVAKAAMGGVMEVEAGNLAQQNGQSERVKAFAAMMVKDHQNANQELMSLASNRGMNVAPALPPDMQKHMDAMKNMKGRAFDKHYMSMMVNDHKKTVADFQKQANSGSDQDLKAWAAKMLPALQMHRDSAVAINQTIK
jgi:putative membrane protein